MEPVYGFLISFSGFFAFIVLVIFIKLLGHIWVNPLDISCTLRILAALFVALCLSFMIYDVLYGIICFPKHSMIMDCGYQNPIQQIGSNVLILLPAIVLYMFLVKRLKASFDNSQYRLNTFTIWFIFGLIIVSIIFVIVIAIRNVTTIYEPFHQDIITLALLINDMILHSIILGIFLQKLRETTLALFRISIIDDYDDYQKMKSTIENTRSTVSNILLKTTPNQSSVQCSTNVKSTQSTGIYILLY